MSRRLPFLFNMPALMAWPLAVVSGLALLIGLSLVFADTAYNFRVYITALFGPVGLVPLIARWKRMSLIRWSAGVVMLAIVQGVLPTQPLLHPMPVLLAAVYHRPPAPPLPPSQGIGDINMANAGAAEERSSPRESAVIVEAPPAPRRETGLIRRRTSRRRRPRH